MIIKNVWFFWSSFQTKLTFLHGACGRTIWAVVNPRSVGTSCRNCGSRVERTVEIDSGSVLERRRRQGIVVCSQFSTRRYNWRFETKRWKVINGSYLDTFYDSLPSVLNAVVFNQKEAYDRVNSSKGFPESTIQLRFRSRWLGEQLGRNLDRDNRSRSPWTGRRMEKNRKWPGHHSLAIVLGVRYKLRISKRMHNVKIYRLHL